MKVRDKRLTRTLVLQCQNEAYMLRDKFGENEHEAFHSLCRRIDHEGKQYHLVYNVHTIAWELHTGYEEGA